MTASARDIIFNHSERVAPLGLIAIPGSEELGRKVNEYLVTWSQEAGYDYDNFLIENECPRFSSGDGKALIKNTGSPYQHNHAYPLRRKTAQKELQRVA